MKKSKWLLLLVVLISAVALAQVYRWVDEKGNIHFGDTPPKTVDTEELILPEGPSEEEIVQAQEDLRKRLKAKRIADEARESEMQDAEAAALGKVEPKSGIDAIRNEDFVCFTALSAFVEGDSARRFAPITPTELTDEQQMLLKDLFGRIGRRWRGGIIAVTCKPDSSQPDSKRLEFDVKTTVDWNARESQLVVETDSFGRNDSSFDELTQNYEVGDALYIRGGKPLSEGFWNVALKGNRVEILSLKRNTLTFLIKRKHRARPSVRQAEIRYLELTKNQLFFKEMYFTNDTLRGWRIWVLHN